MGSSSRSFQSPSILTPPSLSPLRHSLLPPSSRRSISGFSLSAAQSSVLRRAFQRSKNIPPALRRPQSTVVVHNKGQARVRRTISFLTISTVSLIVGGYLALSYAPPILVPLIMGSMPSDVESLSIYEPPDDFSREIDEHIKNCALAVELREHPDFRESRPHLKIPPEVRQHSLTASCTAGSWRRCWTRGWRGAPFLRCRIKLVLPRIYR